MSSSSSSSVKRLPFGLSVKEILCFSSNWIGSRSISPKGATVTRTRPEVRTFIRGLSLARSVTRESEPFLTVGAVYARAFRIRVEKVRDHRPAYSEDCIILLIYARTTSHTRNPRGDSRLLHCFPGATWTERDRGGFSSSPAFSGYAAPD